MTTTAGAGSVAATAPILERIDPYTEWREKEGTALAGGVCEAANIWEQPLGAGYVELAAGEHEVRLGVYFPEN